MVKDIERLNMIEPYRTYIPGVSKYLGKHVPVPIFYMFLLYIFRVMSHFPKVL